KFEQLVGFRTRVEERLPFLLPNSPWPPCRQRRAIFAASAPVRSAWSHGAGVQGDLGRSSRDGSPRQPRNVPRRYALQTPSTRRQSQTAQPPDSGARGVLVALP